MPGPRITSKIVAQDLVEVYANGELLVTIEHGTDEAPVFWAFRVPQGTCDLSPSGVRTARELNHLLDWIADEAATLPPNEFDRLYPARQAA